MGSFESSNMRLLSGLTSLLSLTSVSVLATQPTTEKAQARIPSCKWGPLVLQHPICSPTSDDPSPDIRPSPFSKSREEWRALGWDGPNDCLSSNPDYCLYAKIPDEGKSIDGSPFIVLSTAKSMAAIASTQPPPSTGEKQPISPGDYYAQEIPGKGTGLVANRTIKKGEIIMSHTPTLLIQFDIPGVDTKPGDLNGADGLTWAERTEMYEKAVERMDSKSRKKFLRQVGGDIVEVVDKNAFRISLDGDDGHLGVWPDVSLFNHDCRPK